MKVLSALKSTAFLLIISHAVNAQIILGPSIGVTSLPGDNDAVCTIPTYLDPNMSFESPGVQNGDTFPHFKLYKTNGDSVDLLVELQAGKPVLLVGGSITCNVFRGKIADINTIATTYANDIKVFVIYNVEAHPDNPDPSPYSGTVWIPAANYTDNCLFNQPTTYKQRKDLADTTDARYNLIPDILIDGPCNPFWTNIGTAPNSAYLIEPNGRLFKKHGWFNRQNIYNMAEDIDSLLNMLSVPLLNDAVSITVYPNPFSDELHVTGCGVGSKEILIYNSVGQLLIKEQFHSANTHLSTRNLLSGAYFYEIKAGNFVKTGKLIRQ